MLLRAMIRYCRGTVHFAVSGPYPERFLNLCAQGGLGLWNVRQQPGGLSACCALSHRRQLEYYAQKSGLTLTVTKCAGMPPTVRRYRRRTGLWIGLGLLAVGLLVMGQFVWQVEVTGLESLSAAEITDALTEYGVHPGAWARGIDAKTVERKMQVRFAGIAWVSVNIEGCRATAVIEEAVIPPAPVEDGVPTNLVAAYTGFITRIEVFNGNPVVRPGDSVQAGDLLISGIMDNKMGESRTAHARGQVYALTRERVEIEIPYRQVKYTLRGIVRRRYLTLFGVAIPLQAKGAPAGPYRLEHSETAPGGLLSLLPVRMTEECYLLLNEESVTIPLEEAQRRAEKALALREKEWAGVTVQSRNLTGTETPAGYTLTAEYLLERQIGQETPVQTEEREAALPEE